MEEGTQKRESNQSVQNNKMGNDQIYDLLTNRELSWQTIIYDLINTEQLDPWDLDLGFLAKRYLEKIHELEEADFFISSKVLLAASLLLRIKSEILLNEYIKSIDEILFGKEVIEKKALERIEIDESELPLLTPKTPLPRLKKVTLQELMQSLEKAIQTESRRIRKEINKKKALRQAEMVFPRTRVNIKERIRKIYSRILTMFKQKQASIPYTELVGTDKEERIAAFLPILHLDSQKKLFLEQEKHFSEIYVWLYSLYKKKNPELEALREHTIEEIEKEKQEIETEIEEESSKHGKELKKINAVAGFDNPLADFFNLA